MYRSIGNLTILYPVSILTVSSEGEGPAAEFRHAVADLSFTIAISQIINSVTLSAYFLPDI